jgi:hypothetical protein
LTLARLLNPKIQETYFSTIVQRYMSFCAATGKDQDLNAAFGELSVANTSDPTHNATPSKNTPTSKASPWRKPSSGPKDAAIIEDSASSKELSTLLMAMRKLREALVATHRGDAFAQRSLMFITRATILTSSYEAYYPSLMRLLEYCHSRYPLSASDLREFTIYHILDLACRQGAYAEALLAKRKWGIKDERIEGVLLALIRNDWVRYWRMSATLDGYQKHLLAFAEDGMRRHALKCLGRSYLAVDRAFVEKSTGRSWTELKKVDQVGWELEGERVVIRKVKKASAA